MATRITSNKVVRAVQAERFTDAEDLLLNATGEELNRIWQDAGYIKERARYLLKTRFGVIKP